MTTLNDRVIAVTGGSRGFGLAIAKALISRGARVALLARGTAELDKAVAVLGADKAAAFPVDIGNRDSVQAAFAAIGRHFGRLDGLVNNAGVARPNPLDKVEADEFAMQWQVNVGGVLFCTQAALPWLRKSDNGRILNITSASARHMDEMSHLGIYASTKAAVERMTAEWREELKSEGIGVTIFSPGHAMTDFAAGWDMDRTMVALKAWLGKGPMHDQGMDVRDVGEAVAHCFTYPAGVAVDMMEVRPNRPGPKPVF